MINFILSLLHYFSPASYFEKFPSALCTQAHSFYVLPSIRDIQFHTRTKQGKVTQTSSINPQNVCLSVY